MTDRLRAIGAFWYDFVVGDDWRLAAGVCAALAATYLLSVSTSLGAWWLLPVTIAVLLPASLVRAVRSTRPSR